MNKIFQRFRLGAMMIVMLCIIFCGLCLSAIGYFFYKYNIERNELMAQLRDILERYGEIIVQKA
ncbi:MAG: DUF5305 domain-containing protein, partial [Puniceicoccales bacterium]|nr:DUF5305 domain-containing protein [Puniceicoccales bacterium]